ncbi:MAG: hypothetical protein R3C10_09920 [Pirellulales bacterium]
MQLLAVTDHVSLVTRQANLVRSGKRHRKLGLLVDRTTLVLEMQVHLPLVGIRARLGISFAQTPQQFCTRDFRRRFTDDGRFTLPIRRRRLGRLAAALHCLGAACRAATIGAAALLAASNRQGQQTEHRQQPKSPTIPSVSHRAHHRFLFLHG